MEFTISLLGCGSLGSFLADSIIAKGANKLKIMDKDFLLPENVVRHLCDLADATGTVSKVSAVREKLLKKFSNFECIIYQSDVLEYLYKDKREFFDCDYLIVCVGSLSVERRIDFCLRKNIIRCPVSYLWVEPYGVASHILHIPREGAGRYLDYFTKDGGFVYSVVNDGHIFSKREAGCQASYTPYGPEALKIFAPIATDIIFDFIANKDSDVVLNTWVNDVGSIQKLGISINQAYKNKKSGLILTRIL